MGARVLINGIRYYYPKMGVGLATSGAIIGTREMAIAACKAAIDKWLGPKN